MGIKLGKVFDNAVKGVSGLVDKTGKRIAEAIDQNGDGKLDFSDIQTISDRIQARRKADLEKLKPVFPDDFEGAEFVLPNKVPKCVLSGKGCAIAQTTRMLAQKQPLIQRVRNSSLVE